MKEAIKKTADHGVSVSVNVDVEKIVKYLCIAGIVITAIVAVCKVVPSFFNKVVE